MRKLWLVFAQSATVCVAVLFVVSTLRPDLLAWHRRDSVVTIKEPPVEARPMRIANWILGLGLAYGLGLAPAQAVVGGREGGPAEAATLMVLNARGGVCTGIVLSSRAILTAAHCAAGGTELRIHWRAGKGLIRTSGLGLQVSGSGCDPARGPRPEA